MSKQDEDKADEIEVAVANAVRLALKASMEPFIAAGDVPNSDAAFRHAVVALTCEQLDAWAQTNGEDEEGLIRIIRNSYRRRRAHLAAGN